MNHWPIGGGARYGRATISASRLTAFRISRAFPKCGSGWCATIARAESIVPGVLGLQSARLPRFAHRHAGARDGPAREDLCHHRRDLRRLTSAPPIGRPATTSCACAHRPLSGLVEAAQAGAPAIADSARRTARASASGWCCSRMFPPRSGFIRGTRPTWRTYFDADAGNGGSNSRSADHRLANLATPLDWVSEQPEAITIEAADAVGWSCAPQWRCARGIPSTERAGDYDKIHNEIRAG